MSATHEAFETVAGRYRLLRRLARGGMGEVFAAVDLANDRHVALKRMLPSTPRQRGTLVVNFMREYHALAELRHPRIIEVYDYGVYREAPYYTMELLDGQDLSEVSPLPYREACHHLRDVASSLALLHARRLLHRDVSPRNVRRTSDGRCKLLDFGTMVPFGTPPNVAGTPPCIAPEVLQGAPLDQRSDLYALGALAYSALTGRHAFAVTEIAALPAAWRVAPPRPKRLVRGLPDELDTLVMSLLSLDPQKRPGSAADVIDWLSAIGELAPDDSPAVARSFLTSSQLVGREHECSQLRRYVSAAVSGRGAAALIGGESGVGRSRMLAEAALIAQTSGLTVVRVVARKQRGAASALLSDLVLGLHQAAPNEALRASRSRPLVAAELSRATFGSARPAAAGGKVREQLLVETAEYVRDVARERPLLITIDDLDRADELSSALVAELAHQAAASSLVVIATHDTQKPRRNLASVRGLASKLTLRPLDRSETTQLIASLFGDVANLERVSDWLHRVAGGSPKLILELAEHLMNRQIVRYVDGSWLLPAEVDEPVPPSASATLMLRLHGVSMEARALAETLCVSRGGASAADLLDLARQPPERAFRALEELVRAGIFESAGDEYVFAQDALRKALARALLPARRQELHTRWATRLLTKRPDDRDARLEAGWHLVHTDQELRGAELLATVAPELVERRVGMTAAVPALERALEVYERHGRPLAVRLRLRASLALSSYLFDPRLAERYATGTLDALYPFTGIAEMIKLRPVFGKWLAFVLAVLWVSLRGCLRPRSTRGPNVVSALMYYTRSAIGLVGHCALKLDPAGAAAALERLRGYEDHPIPGLKIAHASGCAIALYVAGRGSEVQDAIRAALARLDGKPPLGMSEPERLDLTTGLLLLIGINDCYRELSRALDSAARLERIDTPLAKAAALRISMTYHLMRGNRERTQHFRRLLDLSALRDGTSWQVEHIAVPIEAHAATLWSDVTMLRRSLDRLEQLAVDTPSLASMREIVRANYLFRRGDFAATVEVGEAHMRLHPPFTVLSWASVYAVTAFAYVELGQLERAREICERGLGCISEQHRGYTLLYGSLEAAYATVLALLGGRERERAEQLFGERLAQLRALGEHVPACFMYEYRIKVARTLGDLPAERQALLDMREAALASGQPSMIALADRVSALGAVGRSSPRPPPHPLESSSPQGPERETVVTVFLRGVQEPGLRAQHALVMLAQYAASGEGYLFWCDPQGLQLAASLEERDPPRVLVEQLEPFAQPDAPGTGELELPGAPATRYRVVRLRAGRTVGLAVLRDVSEPRAEIPAGFVREVGRALRSRM